MDAVARYNRRRWDALVEAGALFTRPRLDFDERSARAYLDGGGLLPDVDGAQVLCLAGGGGQQSAAFAVLGARVTVLDLSAAQLRRDQEAAAHYGVSIETIEGDMRDLSRLSDTPFDIVWHPYSLNFVPEVGRVFSEVARVLRTGGLYHFSCSNPFVSGLGPADWTGAGYALRHPYVQGAEISYADEPWVYGRAGPGGEPIPPPTEYRHTLATLVNGLAERGFVLRHLSDSTGFHPDSSAEPGTWDHFTAVAPPWLAFWAVYQPSIPSGSA